MVTNFFFLPRSWNPIWRLESGLESGKYPYFEYMQYFELEATDQQNSDVYSYIFVVALFNGVCSDNPLCSYLPEIGWKIGSTYSE